MFAPDGNSEIFKVFIFNLNTGAHSLSILIQAVEPYTGVGYPEIFAIKGRTLIPQISDTNFDGVPL